MKSKEKEKVSILNPDLRDRLNAQREKKMLNPDEVQALQAAIKSASLAIAASYASERQNQAKKDQTD